MELPTYFNDFLGDIRLQPNHLADLMTGHSTLRGRLLADTELAPCIVSTFLQGSYRRSTAVRPKSGKRSDVDVVVVTRLSMDDYPNPDDALDVFTPFLDKHYKDKYERQGRSIGITLSYVDLDLVITAAPSESEEGIYKSDSVVATESLEEVKDWHFSKSWLSPEHRTTALLERMVRFAQQEAEWKTEPLYIPNRDAQVWQQTHPLAQIQWTQEKNKNCNGHYINVVKAIKWWRRVNHETPKYPKGYPVEHLIGQCCPDGITSVAAGIVLTLEAIARDYAMYASLKMVPCLPDHGVPTHDVLARVSGEDFAAFHAQVSEAAQIARQAYEEQTVRESAILWRQLFGDRFPEPPAVKGGEGNDPSGPTRGGFTAPTGVSQIRGGRYA